MAQTSELSYIVHSLLFTMYGIQCTVYSIVRPQKLSYSSHIKRAKTKKIWKAFISSLDFNYLWVRVNWEIDYLHLNYAFIRQKQAFTQQMMSQDWEKTQ